MSSAYESIVSEINDKQKRITQLEAENHSLRVSNNDLQEKVSRQAGMMAKLREENAYVNDMLENAHNRSRLLEAKLQTLGVEI